MSFAEGLQHIVRENEPLAPRTRIGIGGTAQYFAEPTNEEELITLVKRCAEQGLSVRLIGEGSNVLVPDAGVQGLVIALTAPDFCRISVDGSQMTCAGGTSLSHFVSTAVREGFSGPENLVGYSGTVGGALHVNTSAHGFDIGSCVASARVLDRAGEVSQKNRDSMNFSYRQSSLDELAVLEATFEFEKEDPVELTRRMQKLWIVHRASHALTENAIQVFKDHGGEPASDLIDQCGLKGTRIGDIEVSDSDPNTFVADSDATAADFLKLVELVEGRVQERLEVQLERGFESW